MEAHINSLLPQPQRREIQEGTFSMPPDLMIHLVNAAPTIYPIAQRLQRSLADHGVEAEITAIDRPLDAPHVVLRLDPDDAVYVQGYRLHIAGDQVTITGADAAGLFYGVVTLGQLAALHAGEAGVTLPCLKIMDWPDFPHRGVMLDVSRDRVPTMATLYALVDLLASWKLNQLQLYMEHTFAYRGHQVVWEDASPFTGEEMMALDAYCRERFVELVPNQNSFGHMHRWLVHDEYRDLAECPEGCELWPGHGGEPFSLCPIDPGSIALVEDLYDQLLPHFTSDLFNVGLDETFDLGKGRSADLCEEQGTERVYLDFLLQIHELVQARGRTMQFWGDIILHEPDLIPELPRDAVAMEWGYEASHPFAEHCHHFAEAGLRFYVCPGTSSWNTIAGRTDNALGNIESAAKSGKEGGAVGLLNTDWGDNGHLQPLPVSYLGYMAGAAASWNAATPLDAMDLPAMLDRFAFFDAAGVMGRVAYDLGNVYRLVGVEPSNASALFLLLLNPDHALGEGWGAGLSQDGLQDALDAIAEVREHLGEAQMARADADLIKDEFAWAADLLGWAARLGAARLRLGAMETAATLPADLRAELAAAMRDLVERHRALWLRRSRPGGLADSAARLERVIEVLES
jgi:hypothetical protein